MSKIIDTTREIIFHIPFIKLIYQRWVYGRKGIHAFEGWGMTTDTLPPWHNDTDTLTQDFIAVHNQIIADVESGVFTLQQFEGLQDKTSWLNELRWRHFIVFWSARYAAKNVQMNTHELVECGVCDGLTVRFALEAFGGNSRAWLYDTWEAMKAENLLKSEQKHAGDYSYLSMETTQHNLKEYETVFVKGYIPDSFKSEKQPGQVSWMHIDLNASCPTKDSLDEFYNKVLPGGVILFDDYALPAYKDTKTAVDTFFADKPGILFHCPTGQALYFKIR